MLGWKGVTDAAHAKGGKIFLQLMHTGRVTALANLPTGAEVLGPTAETCAGDMYADKHSMQPHSLPREMAMPDIAATAEEYAESAHLAITAGFDGVELHAANGMRDGVGVRKASQKEGANHVSRDSHGEMTIRLSKPTCFVLLAYGVTIHGGTAPF